MPTLEFWLVYFLIFWFFKLSFLCKFWIYFIVPPPPRWNSCGGLYVYARDGYDQKQQSESHIPVKVRRFSSGIRQPTPSYAFYNKPPSSESPWLSYVSQRPAAKTARIINHATTVIIIKNHYNCYNDNNNGQPKSLNRPLRGLNKLETARRDSAKNHWHNK